MNRERRILVVDDYAPSRYAFRRILSAGNYQVIEAEDAASARDALRGDDADAVILDVNLPGQSGIELCHELKQERPDLPVILISASYRAHGIEAEWQEAGAVAFLEQPINADDLVAVLERVIESGTADDTGA
jgi:DNA-binding NtrC family response regulator